MTPLGFSVQIFYYYFFFFQQKYCATITKNVHNVEENDFSTADNANVINFLLKLLICYVFMGNYPQNMGDKCFESTEKYLKRSRSTFHSKYFIEFYLHWKICNMYTQKVHIYNTKYLMERSNIKNLKLNYEWKNHFRVCLFQRSIIFHIKPFINENSKIRKWPGNSLEHE